MLCAVLGAVHSIPFHYFRASCPPKGGPSTRGSADDTEPLVTLMMNESGIYRNYWGLKFPPEIIFAVLTDIPYYVDRVDNWTLLGHRAQAELNEQFEYKNWKLRATTRNTIKAAKWTEARKSILVAVLFLPSDNCSCATISSHNQWESTLSTIISCHECVR